MNDKLTQSVDRKELARSLVASAISANRKGLHEQVGIMLEKLQKMIEGNGIYATGEGGEG